MSQGAKDNKSKSSMHGTELLFSTKYFGHHPKTNGAYDLNRANLNFFSNTAKAPNKARKSVLTTPRNVSMWAS